MLRGGKNIKYNASTTIRMQPRPWPSESMPKIVNRSESEISDEATLNYFKLTLDFSLIKKQHTVSVNVLDAIIKLTTLMIINKHCV